MAIASFPLEEFDDNFLTCPVCEEMYDDPRTLPCLHAFCAKCLEQWRKGKSQFTCPTCRQQVRLQGAGVGSLPVSFYINDMLGFRTLHSSEKTHAHCQMCESGVRVQGVCADCRFLLCKNCITAHGNIPALKDHYITTLHDVKNQGSKQKYTRTRAQYCSQHTDQRMTFYCQPCAKLVCRDCTITEHRPGPNHDPQEASKVAQKYRHELQRLALKTMGTAETLKKTKDHVGKALVSIKTNCQTVRREIQQHFAELRAIIDEKEKRVTDELDEMEMSQEEPLLKKEKELENHVQSIEDGLKLCTDTLLTRGNDVEILTLRQQLEGRLYDLSVSQMGLSFTTSFVRHEASNAKIAFQPHSLCTDLVKCYLFLTDKHLFTTKAPVESLPTTVVFRPHAGLVLDNHPQVTVTSPGGQCTTLDTTKTSLGAFEAVWRPQTSGKHVVGVATGRGGGVESGEVGAMWEETRATRWVGQSLCFPVTVNVGSNNPVLRFGQEGSQLGQFDEPIDVAIRGDRLYVADTWNSRVQVFDLSGKFRHSFSTPAKPVSLAVQTDGIIVVKSDEEVLKCSPSGELLHRFPLGRYCTNPYGIAVQRDGRVVVADPCKHSIFLFEADGTMVKEVCGQGQWEGQFNSPCFVCVDKGENIFVTDKCNCRVQVFDKNLNFQYKFGHWGRQPQDMWFPIGVSADSRGNILLANLGNTVGGIGQGEKVQVFRSDGTWVSTISSDGDKLNNPHGVAVTEDGHVFVADPGDHCVRKYRYM